MITGLKHVAGTLSMAQSTSRGITSEFMILLDDQPSLNYGGTSTPDGKGAAAFGRVTIGMDVVRAIHASAVSGQFLNPPIQIQGIFRITKQPGN